MSTNVNSLCDAVVEHADKVESHISNIKAHNTATGFWSEAIPGKAELSKAKLACEEIKERVATLKEELSLEQDQISYGVG